MVRIPVDHLNEANIAWLVHSNVCAALLVPAALVAWLLLARARPSRTTAWALPLAWGLAGFLAVGAVAIEHYWHAECPVSEEKFRNSETIVKQTARCLLSQPEDWQEAHPWSLADGTALCYVRKYTELMRWDQDSDLLMQYDVQRDPTASDLVGRVEKCYAALTGFKVVYFPDRALLQVHHTSGAHGDIWLWERRTVQQRDCLYNPDFTYSHLTPVANCIPYDVFHPPQLKQWNLGGEVIDVRIHNNLHAYLTSQFGSRYMEPYRNRLQCTENLGKHADKSWLVGYSLAGLAAGLYAARFAQRHAARKQKGRLP